MLNKNRIEAFSDGVIAIIITVMVFDLKIPALAAGFSDADVWAALQSMLPKLAAYALSYLVLAIMWINHHALFDKIQQSSSALVWHNALLLFAISLIPLPTAFLASNPLLPQAVMFYGAVMSLNSGSFLLLRRYVEVRAGMVKYNAAVHRSNFISLTLYLLSLPLAFVSVYVSYVIFVGIPVWYFIPERQTILSNQSQTGAQSPRR